MNVAETTLAPNSATSFARPRLAPADVRNGLALVGLILGYALIVDLLGHPRLQQLLTTLGNFAGLSFYAGTLAASAFGLLCLLRPDFRTNLPTRMFWLAIACVLTTLVFPFYAAFKELVLPMRGFVWDRALNALSHAVFGESPWTVVHLYFGTVAGTRLLDWAYRSLLPMMFGLPLIAAVLVTNSRLRFRILFTWTASWILIGTLAGWFFASAGPCYYNSFIAYDPDYAELQRRLAEIGRLAAAQGHPIASLTYQSGLLLTYRTHDFAPGGGISAMPSMHVAMVTLVALAAWKFNRVLGILGAYLVFAVWVSTIHFGWHYFIDGPVGAAMMVLLWLVARRVAAIAYPQAEATAASTA